MNTSRREFIGSAAAFGLGGRRLFAAPSGWKHGGKPNLVFGVISDTHLRTANWERIWGEPYSDVWHKEVKGYHFFGRHWGVNEGNFAKLLREQDVTPHLSDGIKPFFLLSQ